MDSATDHVASFPAPLSDLERYGSVPPEDRRLLLILPNGFPLYEVPCSLGTDDCVEAIRERQSTSGVEEEPIMSGVDAANKTLLQVERRLKRITGSLDALRYKMEKYFVVMDHEVRVAQMKDDPVFRNQDKLLQCEKNKAEAINKLIQLRQLFQLAGLPLEGSPTGSSLTPQAVSFVPSVNLASSEDQWKSLVVILARRMSLYTRLLSQTTKEIRQCETHKRYQLSFLRIVSEVQKYWPLQKVPYAVHVFEKGDDYPYRAELRVDLFNLPWNCWGYDRPRHWSFPGTTPDESDLASNQVPPPPFLCWPPLPAAPPCAPLSAEIYFTSPPKQSSSPNPGFKSNTDLGIQIRWVGDASHCIESNRQLRVRIIPVFLKQRTASDPARDSSTDRTMRDAATINTVEPSADESSSFSPPKIHSELPSLLPDPLGTNPSWMTESIELHRRLQTAQWRLLDRAVHLIYQAQAARLKSILDVVSYGTAEASENARLILEEFEGVRSNLFELSCDDHLELSVATEPTTSSDAVDDSKGNDVPKPSRHQRCVTVQQWEAYTTSISLRRVPVFDSSPAVGEIERSKRNTGNL